MNRDDIIRMAVEAGFSLNELNKEDDSDHIWYEVNFTDLLLDLREFAKLVAAAEREACANMILTLTCMGNAKECFEVAACYVRARGQK